MFLQSRRHFFQKGFVGGAVLVFCSGRLFGAVSTMQTIQVLQEDLFGNTTNAPTPQEVRAQSYLAMILQHSRVSQKQKEFIRNGIQWLNEEALEMFHKSYVALAKQQREAVLQSVTDSRWGESFVHAIFAYLFEAMLGDPIYGINTDESGWKWLQHHPGLPRPKKAVL